MAKKETSIGHDIAIITAITVVAGFALGGVHAITAEPIAREEARQEQEAKEAVFADASDFKDIDWDSDEFSKTLEENGLDQTTVYSVSEAVDDSGNKLGYVVDSGNNEGYGGEVELMVGITTGDDGLVINGISFLNLEETAGMGMKAEDPEFKDQFNNMDIGDATQIEYTKSGKTEANQIDAISGCTITTNAVTKAVNGALMAVESLEEGN